jgi:protocatechuate 3,4-dioxygenase beta subunit
MITKVKSWIGCFLFILLFLTTVWPQCKCGLPQSGETTHYGGNELTATELRGTYTSLHGVVKQIYGQPLSGVLVEVFDHPEWIQQKLSKSEIRQRRVAVCKTRRNGKFCFDKIPSGHYELRLSKNKAWNVLHFYVVINPKSPESIKSGFEIVMSLGK